MEDGQPAVCRIADLGKLRYEANKKAKKTSSSSKIKEVQFGTQISTHDLENKVTNILRFLTKESNQVIPNHSIDVHISR
jgi:translation initiation factor IF-3